MDVPSPDIGIGTTLRCARRGRPMHICRRHCSRAPSRRWQRGTSARRVPLERSRQLYRRTGIYRSQRQSPRHFRTDELKIKCFALHSIYVYVSDKVLKGLEHRLRSCPVRSSQTLFYERANSKELTCPQRVQLRFIHWNSFLPKASLHNCTF